MIPRLIFPSPAIARKRFLLDFSSAFQQLEVKEPRGTPKSHVGAAELWPDPVPQAADRSEHGVLMAAETQLIQTVGQVIAMQCGREALQP